jgi:hypothetical protein
LSAPSPCWTSAPLTEFLGDENVRSRDPFRNYQASFICENIAAVRDQNLILFCAILGWKNFVAPRFTDAETQINSAQAFLLGGRCT